MNDACLLLDATNRWIVCGLNAGGKWHTRTLKGAGLASGKLVPLIGQLLEESAVERPDWIVAARGPGSFTGARLTVSTARNLAQFWDVPVLGVESLVYYARVCRSAAKAVDQDKPIGVLIDGKQNRVFARLIQPGTEPADWQEESVLDIAPAELREIWPSETQMFVDDEAAVRKYLGDEWTDARFQTIPEPDAGTFYDIALALGGRASAVPFAELLPVYARPDPAQAKYPEGYTPSL